MDLWICEKARGGRQKLNYAYARKDSKNIVAKFADHTAGVAGKLSLKERDVSCCCFFDAF